MINRKIFSIVFIIIFLIGSGVIIYRGRPVMKIKQYPGSGSVAAPPTGGAYTMADVAAHNSLQSCWSAINGAVYDLTDFINRHPGGPGHIITLCGTDGSEAFNFQHGGNRGANAALILLKIGDLKQ